MTASDDARQAVAGSLDDPCGPDIWDLTHDGLAELVLAAVMPDGRTFAQWLDAVAPLWAAIEEAASWVLDLQMDVEGLRRENVRLMRVLDAAREVIALEAEVGSRAPFVIAWDVFEAAVQEADRG